MRRVKLELFALVTLIVFGLFAVLLAVSHFLLMGYRKQVSHDFRMICKKAVAPLQTPIIILGGILVGVFTPTEASAVAVAPTRGARGRSSVGRAVAVGVHGGEAVVARHARAVAGAVRRAAQAQRVTRTDRFDRVTAGYVARDAELTVPIDV